MTVATESEKHGGKQGRYSRVSGHPENIRTSYQWIEELLF